MTTPARRASHAVRAFARRLRNALCAASLMAASSALFAQTPVYRVTTPDAITGDNVPQVFTHPNASCPAGSPCRLPDPNPAPGGSPVDSYTRDVYERPTSSGSGASQYFPAIDITSSQVGYDATWLYYRINLYGVDASTGNLPYFYSFELNYDADGRGDMLIRVASPGPNVGTTFGTNGVIAFLDSNNNIGGPTAFGPDGPGNAAGGYEFLAFDQGSNNLTGAPGGNNAVVARIVPGTPNAVEIAVKRVFLTAANSNSAILKAGFRPYAAKGSIGEAFFYLHDNYGRNDSGSPYPFLQLAGAPASCPNGSDSGLTVTQRNALDSGTSTNTGIFNPCYPTTGIYEIDNAGTLESLASGTDIYFVTDITGRVFEDVNYGGGAGRACGAVSASPACSTTASAVGRTGVRVELYNAAGAFVATTTTNANGDYTFASQPADTTYTVRAVNATLTSSRTGAVAGLLPTQTFRTSGLTGNAGAADVNRVGGERPDLADAGNGAAGTSLNTTTGVFTAGISGQAQSIATFTAGATSPTISGIDFGFNFDTIVNVNNTGQGSLRQFIVNSNALGGEGVLAQSGSRIDGTTGATLTLPAGRETSIFMVPGGAAVPGLRAGLTNQLTGGVAVFNVTTALPQITGPLTVIDGGSQTFNVGNSNAGSLGAGGTVGTGATPLATVQRPEVMLIDGNALAAGIEINANDTTVRALAIYGFGGTPASGTQANLMLRNGRVGAMIEGNVIGTSASSFADPGATRSGGDNIRSEGADNATIRNNLIGYAAGNGISITNGSLGWQVTGNEIRGNAVGNTSLSGIEIDGNATPTVSANLIAAHSGSGIDNLGASVASTIRNNTIFGNGVGAVETAGVRIAGPGSLIELNVISANYGAGVMVTSAATAITISRNSIFANGTITTAGASGTPNSGQIGIDLLAGGNLGTGTAPFVTLNDIGDVDGGGNALLNHPVLLTAAVSGANLTLTGYARPGSAIEFFIAAADPSGFGEGQTYLVTLTEGSAADTDIGTGTYGPTAVNGIAQGTDTTNRFSFVIATPSGLSSGAVLTATATIAGATSEFSGGVTVSGTSPAALTHLKTSQVLGDPFNGAVNPKAIPGAEMMYTLAIANTGSGQADNNTVVVTDPIPSNTRLFLGDLSLGAGPVAFVQGTPSSALTWTYGGLASAADDLEFSNDGGATFTLAPTAAGDGYDATVPRVTHLRMRPKGQMAGTSGGGNPTFSLRFKVRIE